MYEKLDSFKQLESNVSSLGMLTGLSDEDRSVLTLAAMMLGARGGLGDVKELFPRDFIQSNQGFSKVQSLLIDAAMQGVEAQGLSGVLHDISMFWWALPTAAYCRRLEALEENSAIRGEEYGMPWLESRRVTLHEALQKGDRLFAMDEIEAKFGAAARENLHMEEHALKRRRRGHDHGPVPSML